MNNQASQTFQSRVKQCLIAFVICSFSQLVSAVHSDVRTNFAENTNTNIKPLLVAQSNQGFRSKSQVMSEVKGRYGGQVLKISLNEKSASYSVRILLPSGKVKNVQVSARK